MYLAYILSLYAAAVKKKSNCISPARAIQQLRKYYSLRHIIMGSFFRLSGNVCHKLFITNKHSFDVLKSQIVCFIGSFTFYVLS